MQRVVFRCDGAPLPRGLATDAWEVQALDRVGSDPNVRVELDKLWSSVAGLLSPNLIDLIRIAAFAFAADLRTRRSSDTDIYGKSWHRQFVLAIPVVEPKIWSRPGVSSLLSEALGFLTDDRWEFAFTPATREFAQLPLQRVDDDQLLGDPTEVLLFSGGADSLCAAVQELRARGARPLLLSHRTTPGSVSHQKELAEALRARLAEWHFPQLGAWIGPTGGEATERTRRSRGFLHASLGTAVAGALGLKRVVLADNGIVSLGLATNQQLVGALSSRATHPKFLSLFEQFVRAAGVAVSVANPLWNQTRADSLRTLDDHGVPELLSVTRSCARPRHAATHQRTHCGVCSQCVDRRFGVIAAGLEQHDPASAYLIDIFKDRIPDDDARPLVLDHARYALQISETPREGFFREKFADMTHALVPGDPNFTATANGLVDLVQRHGKQTLGVIRRQIEVHSEALAAHRLDAASFLPLWLEERDREPSPLAQAREEEHQYVFRCDGDVWLLRYGKRPFRLKNAKGLQQLHYLMQRPGQDVLAIELAAAGQHAVAAMSGVNRATVDDSDLRPTNLGGLGPQYDERAKREFRQTIQELETDINEAEGNNDAERASVLREQRDQILELLASSLGLSGRDRPVGSDIEKARVGVTKNVKSAIRKIGSHDERLHRHLQSSIATGRICSYRPEEPVNWQF